MVFEELGRDDCLGLLRDEAIGRVALTARALPVVLPVNFALLEGDIVWRSAQGTKLNDASTGFVVAFEVDHYEPDHKQGWSVMVQGLAHVITEADELQRARMLPLESWALEAEADRYVCLVPNIVTGMRIRQLSAPRPPDSL
jgi:nitroimidazol reductase NimA-like FMN-containing flavoprotein (pyridoxamine 5'-phosphate oxidase superfamily)